MFYFVFCWRPEVRPGFKGLGVHVDLVRCQAEQKGNGEVWAGRVVGAVFAESFIWGTV